MKEIKLSYKNIKITNDKRLLNPNLCLDKLVLNKANKVITIPKTSFRQKENAITTNL